jgi:hypothetical protein
MDFKPLLQELGIDKLPEADQKEILEIAFRTVFKRVILRMALELTDEQVAQFEKAVKHGDKAAQEALVKIYPNFKEVYQEEIDGLKRDILSVTPGHDTPHE